MLGSLVLLREAARSIRRHRLRSALTMLGISIGIGAVVLVVALGQAGKARAEEALQNLGDNLVWVEAGSRNIAGVRTGTHGTTSLMIDDAQAIRRDIRLIKRVSPQIDGGGQSAGQRQRLTGRSPSASG